jgi:hypothetical protein
MGFVEKQAEALDAQLKRRDFAALEFPPDLLVEARIQAGKLRLEGQAGLFQCPFQGISFGPGKIKQGVICVEKQPGIFQNDLP